MHATCHRHGERPAVVPTAEAVVADAAPLDRLPEAIRTAFTLVERAQREGARPVSDGADSTRRFELPDHGIVYFTDATRPVGVFGVLTVIAALIGLCGLVGGVVLIIESSEWSVPVVAAGALAIYAAVRFSRVDSARTDRRRAGVETEGLYLLPDALVIRGSRGSRVFPRRAIILRFGTRRRSRSGESEEFFEILEYRALDGRVRSIDLHDECEALRALCQRWLET